MGSTRRWDGISWQRSLAVVITLLQIQAVISVETTAVTGREGETFYFQCEYPKGWENSAKYLCYAGGNDCTYLVRADKHNEWVTEGRFSLFDNTSRALFIVKVDELRSDDSGKYWCGVDLMFRPDHLSGIELNVSEANVLPAFTTGHTVHRFTLQLFLTAALCIVALVFVCLFTFCLLLAVKQRRSTPHQKKQTSSHYETVMKGTDLCATCTDPNCPYLSVLSTPPVGHDVTSKHRQSVLSLGFGDYVDIDVPRHISQYQHLNFSQQEDHIYDSLHENCTPTPGHRAH